MLKILDDLNNELKTMFIGGIKSKDDKKLKDLSNEFNKLGENMSIFKTVSLKIDELIKNECNGIILMELSLITYSIMDTQCGVEVAEYNKNINFSNKELKLKKIKYLEFKQLLELLSSDSEKYHKEIQELYDSERYDDLRLYKVYCKGIKDKKTYVSEVLENKIMPAIGKPIVPFIKQELKLNGTKKDAILFKILYEIEGSEITSLSKLALRSSNEFIVAEAVATLGIEHEEMLIKLTNNSILEIIEAAYEALAKNNSLKGEELIIEELKKENIKIISRALMSTKNNKIITALIDEIKVGLTDWKRQETKTLRLIDILFEKNYKNKCKDTSIFEYVLFILENIEFSSDAWYRLSIHDRAKDLIEIVECEVLYNSFIKNEGLVDLAIDLATKIYSKEEIKSILIKVLRNNYIVPISEYIKNESSLEFINIMIDETRRCIETYTKLTNEEKNSNLGKKISILITTLIEKDDKNSIEFIKEVYKYSDKEVHKDLDCLDISTAVNHAIELSKTRERDEYLYDLFYNSGYASVKLYAMKLCMQIFSEEKIYDDFKCIFESQEVYDKFLKAMEECNKEIYILHVIMYCLVKGDMSYSLNESIRKGLMNIEDDLKHWDRRWGKTLTQEYVLKLSNVTASSIYGISCMIYRDDVESRTSLLEFVLKSKGHSSSVFLKILSDAFKLNHYKANYYFNEIMERAKKTSTKEKIVNKLISYGVDENLLKQM